MSVAGLAAGARKNQIVLRLVNAGIPGFGAIDAPAIAVAHAGRLHVGSVGTVLGLGDAEGKAHAALEEPIDPLLLLFLGAVGEHQQHADIVGDNRVLGLKIVVQTKALDRQMLPDNRHSEIGAVLAAIPLGERIAIVAGFIGGAARLAQQCLPGLVRQTAAIPIRARRFPSVIEKANIVVPILERFDLAFDKPIELAQILGDILGYIEVHAWFPGVSSPIARIIPAKQTLG